MMEQSTCWICGAPTDSASICGACRDRQHQTRAEGTEHEPAAVVPGAADADTTQPVPIVEPVVAPRSGNPMRWAWRNRRGLLTAVMSGGIAILLVVGISFSWAGATDRADQLENTVDARENDLKRAERKVRKAKREQRKVEKALEEQEVATDFLKSAYRGSQAQLQLLSSQVVAVQDQLRASSLQVLATQECLNDVFTSLSETEEDAVSPSVTSC